MATDSTVPLDESEEDGVDTAAHMTDALALPSLDIAPAFQDWDTWSSTLPVGSDFSKSEALPVEAFLEGLGGKSAKGCRAEWDNDIGRSVQPSSAQCSGKVPTCCIDVGSCQAHWQAQGLDYGMYVSAKV